jgi:transposase-like protein
VVHFYRNVFSHVPAGKLREVSHMLKAIHAQETRATAEAKASAVVRETLTYYGFPDCHWIKIRTNNPLERIMREIRRRTRVVGAFPDGQSCLNLAAARLRHIAGTQWSTRKYMNMAPLRAAQTEAYGAATA